jgi:hypothetical protein
MTANPKQSKNASAGAQAVNVARLPAASRRCRQRDPDDDPALNLPASEAVFGTPGLFLP